MAELHFRGLIHPQRENVSISRPIEFKCGFTRDQLLDVKLIMQESRLEAVVKGEIGKLDLLSVRNLIVYHATTFLDALAWSNGCGYTLEMLSCKIEDKELNMQPLIPVLQQNPPKAPADKDSVLQLLLQDAEGKLQPLRRSLSDFRAAIWSPEDTPFHCFRAVESLFFYFHEKKDRGRSEFCRRLRISDKWIVKKLEIKAGNIRHGRVEFVSDEDRRSAFLYARQAIERFVTLVKLGLPVLPETEFGELVA